MSRELNKQDKKYIEDHYQNKSVRQMARVLNCSHKDVHAYRKACVPSHTDNFRLPRPNVRCRKKWGLILFLLCLVVYNINLREYSGNDTVPNRYIPISILKEFNLDLDEFDFLWDTEEKELPYFIQRGRGHVVSSSPVFPGIINTPFYILPLMKGLDPINRPVVDLLAKFSASFWVSVSVVLLFYIFTLYVPLRYAVFLALIYAFGTLTWAISSQAAWQHGPSALFLCLSLLLTLQVKGGKIGLLPWVGVALACAVMSRPNDLLIALIWLPYLMWNYKKKSFWILGAFLITVLPYLIYNMIYFDSILGGYQKLMSETGATATLYNLGGKSVMSGNMLKGLLGIFVSPSRGIFLFTPFLIFSVWGMVRAWKKEVLFYRILIVALAIVFLWYSRFHAWWAGWSFGLRYSADLLPLICFFFVFVIHDIFAKKYLKYIFIFCVIFSIAVQAVGAFSFEIGRWNSSPVDIDKKPERLWDWKDSLITRCIELGFITPDIILRKGGTPFWGWSERGLTEKGVEMALDGSGQEAKVLWERALKVDPYYVGAYVNLGIYWLNHQDVNLAKSYFEKAHALAPEYEKAKKLLDTIEKKINSTRK